jgi:hypothetical protein
LQQVFCQPPAGVMPIAESHVLSPIQQRSDGPEASFAGNHGFRRTWFLEEVGSARHHVQPVLAFRPAERSSLAFPTSAQLIRSIRHPNLWTRRGKNQ